MASDRSPDGQLDLADDLLEVAGSLVRAARRSAGGDLRVELTVAQMELLRLLRRRPGLTATDVAVQLRLASNTVSTLVGQLSARDLVERVPDPRDGRVNRLRLAPQAEQLMAAWRARRLQATASVVATLDEDEVESVAAALPVLRRLAEQLGAPADAASGPVPLPPTDRRRRRASRTDPPGLPGSVDLVAVTAVNPVTERRP